LQKNRVIDIIDNGINIYQFYDVTNNQKRVYFECRFFVASTTNIISMHGVILIYTNVNVHFIHVFADLVAEVKLAV